MMVQALEKGPYLETNGSECNIQNALSKSGRPMETSVYILTNGPKNMGFIWLDSTSKMSVTVCLEEALG